MGLVCLGDLVFIYFIDWVDGSESRDYGKWENFIFWIGCGFKIFSFKEEIIFL